MAEIPKKQIQKSNPPEIPTKYRGYKLLVNNNVFHFRKDHKNRIIEYNLRFFNSLTPWQLKYCLEWARGKQMGEPILKRDEKTTNKLVKMGMPKQEIVNLFKCFNIKNRHDRMFVAMTEDRDKFEQKNKLSFLWKKIKELWK